MLCLCGKITCGANVGGRTFNNCDVLSRINGLLVKCLKHDMNTLGIFSECLITVSFQFPSFSYSLRFSWPLNSPSAAEKADLVPKKVNPTQQDWRMALFLGRKYVGSGQTAVRTFSSGESCPQHPPRWCTYMVYWLPTSIPICSNGTVPVTSWLDPCP